MFEGSPGTGPGSVDAGRDRAVGMRLLRAELGRPRDEDGLPMDEDGREAARAPGGTILEGTLD